MTAGVALLIAVTAAAAVTALIAGSPALAASVTERPLLVGALLAITLILQTLSVDLPARGSVGVSAFGLIVAAISVGAATAMAIAIAAAFAQWVRRHGLFHRAIFDASNFALSAGAAGVVYATIAAGAHAPLSRHLAAATAAGFAYAIVNNGLLCLAVSVSERRSPGAVWNERLHWALLILLAFGPAAGAFVAASERGRAVGTLVFVLLAALLLLGVRVLGRSATVAAARAVGTPSG